MSREVERKTELPPAPLRPVDGHKGTFGRVLIIAGSTGMSGAACLSGLGALRSGAGLVFLAVPESIQSIVATVEPSCLTVGLPVDNAGHVHADAHRRLARRFAEFDAVAIGPGLGTSSAAARLVSRVLADCPQPVVLDADALNAVALDVRLLKNRSGVTVLTPHPGEFGRLLRTPIATVQQRREEYASEFARQNGCVVLLKGHRSVIADGGSLSINETGNSGMATGGTGDVLTGILVALLAQGLSAFDATRLAAHVHGLAGDLAAAELGMTAMIASDLPRFLPAAWRSLESSAHADAK